MRNWVQWLVMGMVQRRAPGSCPLKARACREVGALTGWLKGLGSEGRMCRWAIMACNRSLSLASCERHRQRGVS